MAILLMVIGGYYIINYCWIFYVIKSQIIGSYYIVGFLNYFSYIISFYFKLLYLE